MAIVENNPFNLRGKVGSIIFRRRGGKQYACASSGSRKVSYTRAAISGREKFKFFAKLGNAIGSNYLLDMQWRKPGAAGRTNNQIMKQYYHDVVDYDLSEFNLVNTDKQFAIFTSDLTVASTYINAPVMLPGNESISSIKTPLFSAQGFLFLYNTAYRKKEKFFFIPLSSQEIETALNEEFTVKFRITYRQYKQINLYPVRNLLFNLALKNPSGKPVRFSKTVFYSF